MGKLNNIALAEEALDRVVLRKIETLKIARSIHLKKGSVNSFWKTQEALNMWTRMLKHVSVSALDFDNPDYLTVPENVTSLERSVQSTQREVREITFCSLQSRGNQQQP